MPIVRATQGAAKKGELFKLPGQQNQSVSVCLSVSVHTFKRIKEIYKYINSYKLEFIINLPFSAPPLPIF